jgi:hypothetical protein
MPEVLPIYLLLFTPLLGAFLFPRCRPGLVRLEHVTVEFRPTPDSTSGISEAHGQHHVITARYDDELKVCSVVIDNNVLFVNGTSYGMIHPGEHVVIDHGVVYRKNKSGDMG